MEYKVGSLADLISGSSSKRSKSINSGVKIVYEIVDHEISLAKGNKDSSSHLHNKDNASHKQNRKRSAINDSHNVVPKRKKRKEESQTTGDDSAIEENSSKSFENNADTDNDLKKGKRIVQEKTISENMKNATKRLRKKEKKNKIEHPVDEEKESRTIFVKNLPHNMKKSKIRKIFEKYGAIESTRFRCVALSDPRIPKKVAVIKGKFHPDRTNISAFICYVSKESASQALAANGMLIADHHILVDNAVQEKSHDQRKAVFVGNVPFAAEEDDLWKLFEGCGKILDVRIIRDRNTGIGKGFAYINFESPDAVELALHLNGEKLKQRELRVSRASKKPKPTGIKSSKTTTGNEAKNQVKSWKKKKQHQSSQPVIADSYDRDGNIKPEQYHNVEKKKASPKEINVEERKGSKSVNKKLSVFQGQTMFDAKRKKHKKKLNKDDLKKRMIMKKFGIQPDQHLKNKKKFKH